LMSLSGVLMMMKACARLSNPFVALLNAPKQCYPDIGLVAAAFRRSMAPLLINLESLEGLRVAR
jgi:hypothetical protein